MNFLKTIATVLIVFVLFVNLPARYFSFNYWFPKENLGAVALTDISGSDNISDFPTVQNANNTILENVLNSIIGTTTITTLTSAPALATVGTITSGTWSGTAVAVDKGGTGLTSYTAGDIIYASNTTVLSKLGVGTNGQFLSLSGGLPVWADSAIDQAANYSWTGTHNFAGTATRIKTLIASSTLSIDNGGSATSITIPTGTFASSTIWMFNGSNAGFSRYPQARIFAIESNANASTQATGTTTLKSITLPANTLAGTYKHLRITAFYTQTGVNAACHAGAALGTGSASTTIAFTKTDGPTTAGVFYVDLLATTTSAIGAISKGQGISTTGFSSPSSWSGVSYPTTDLTATAFISLDAKCVNASDTIKLSGYSVEILSQ